MTAASLPVKAPLGGTAMPSLAGRRSASFRHDAIVVGAIVAGQWLTFMAGVLALGIEHIDAIVDSIALGFLYYWLFMAVLLVLTARALEQLALPPWRRRLAAAAAIIVVAVVCALHEYFGPLPVAVDYSIASSRASVAFFALWNAIVVGPLVFAYYAHRRGQLDAARRLFALQSEQRATARRVAEARLQSLQARVDPRLLFDLLEMVQQTYQVDPPRAERLLDELTVFLRTALSRLQGTSSTVGRECELAASYVRLMNLAGSAQAALEVDLAPAAAAARFTPGVVLTIVESLLRLDPAEAIEVSGDCSDNGECGELRISARRAPEAAALARARAVMADLLRDDARVGVQQCGGTFVTTVRLDHAAA